MYYLIFYSFFTSFPFLYFYFNINIIKELTYLDFLFSYEFIFFFCLGFFIKFPVYFLHFWLPKVHVESPTTGRILLAGILLKFGTLGISRLLGSLFFFKNFYIIFIALLGMIFCCLICFFQRDVKSLVAYSSIVHISFLLICFLIFSSYSKVRSLFIIIRHGFTSRIIFFLVGEFFHRSITRIIYYFNRFFLRSINFCVIFSIFFFFNCGIPPRISFYRELLGVIRRISFSVYFFIFFFLYFFFSFYYSLFLLVNSFFGFYFYNISNFIYIYTFSRLFISLFVF